MKCFLTTAAGLLMLSCGNADALRNSNSAEPPAHVSPTAQPLVPEIDLAQIGKIAPAARVQDTEYNQLPVVEQLIARGNESIPFLISKLDDETKIEHRVIDYWYQIYVGDVAFVLLTDFFLDRNLESSTIQGMGWDEFLGRGSNKNITGEQLLRNYIERYGRKTIKARWQNVWDKYRERIYWDEADRNFKVKGS